MLAAPNNRDIHVMPADRVPHGECVRVQAASDRVENIAATGRPTHADECTD